MLFNFATTTTDNPLLVLGLLVGLIVLAAIMLSISSGWSARNPRRKSSRRYRAELRKTKKQLKQVKKQLKQERSPRQDRKARRESKKLKREQRKLSRQKKLNKKAED